MKVHAITRILVVVMFSLFGQQALSAAKTEKEFSVDAGGLLQLDLETGASVTIEGWARDQVKISHKAAGRDSDDDVFEFERTAEGVRIHSRIVKQREKHSSSHELRIWMPHQFDLKLESNGGSLKITDVEGTLQGQTMGGDLDLTGLKGEVNLETMGGNITLKRSDVDGVVSTMGGEVFFEDVQGGVQGESMGGNVKYGNQRPASNKDGEPVVISTHGGSIDVADAPMGADLDTKGGNIRVVFAQKFVDAQTLGGDILIERIDGSVKAITMAGDIKVAMVGDPSIGDRTVHVESNSGEIHVTVPDELDMEIEIALAYTQNSPRSSYEIFSDFPLEMTETPDWDSSQGTPRKTIKGQGRVGSGTHKVYISTINGDVYLKRAR